MWNDCKEISENFFIKKHKKTRITSKNHERTLISSKKHKTRYSSKNLKKSKFHHKITEKMSISWKNVPPFLPKNANFVKWSQKCYFRQKNSKGSLKQCEFRQNIVEQIRILPKNRKQIHTNFVKWSLEKWAIFSFCSLLLVDEIHFFQLLFTCFLERNDGSASFLLFFFQSYNNFYASYSLKLQKRKNK